MAVSGFGRVIIRITFAESAENDDAPNSSNFIQFFA